MNTYQKVIYLYFKKDFSMSEIAMIMDDELRSYRELTYRGQTQCYPPVIAVHKIIGNEVATHYHLGQLDEYRSLRHLVMKTDAPRTKYTTVRRDKLIREQIKKVDN